MKKRFFIIFLLAFSTFSIFAASESDLIDRYFEKAESYYQNKDISNSYKYINMFFKLIKNDSEITDKSYYSQFKKIVPDIFKAQLELLISQNKKDLGITGDINKNIEKMTFLSEKDKKNLRDLSFKVNNISDVSILKVHSGDKFNSVKIKDISFEAATGIYIKEIIPTSSDYKEILPSSTEFCRITVSFEDEAKITRDIFIYVREDDEIFLKNKNNEIFGKIENFSMNELNIRGN